MLRECYTNQLIIQIEAEKLIFLISFSILSF